MTTTVEVIITDNFQESLIELRMSHRGHLTLVAEHDLVLHNFFVSLYSVNNTNVSLPDDFFERMQSFARAVDDSRVTTSFVNLHRSLDTTSSDPDIEQYRLLTDWVNWYAIAFFAFSPGELAIKPVVVTVEKIKAINALLTECKTEYVRILNKIRLFDPSVFFRLVGWFDPFADYEDLDIDFFAHKAGLAENLRLDHLAKCSELLNLSSIPFAQDGQWEIITNICGFIPGFYHLLREV